MALAIATRGATFAVVTCVAVTALWLLAVRAARDEEGVPLPSAPPAWVILFAIIGGVAAGSFFSPGAAATIVVPLSALIVGAGTDAIAKLLLNAVCAAALIAAIAVDAVEGVALAAAIGAAAVCGGMVMVNAVALRTQGSLLVRWGDAKACALVGAMLGAFHGAIAASIAIGLCCAVAVARRPRAGGGGSIAFGPYLAVAAVGELLGGVALR